jgi:ATP-dependent protease ClpP protease subunit
MYSITSTSWKPHHGKKSNISKKRKHEEVCNDDDDEDEQQTIPFIFPKQSVNSVYSQFNHVYFNDDITYESVFALNKELRAVDAKVRATTVALGLEQTPIYLHVTTHGGGIHAAFSVVDCMSQLQLPVYTLADGFVASAGTLITLAG